MYDEVENETNCIGSRVGELNIMELTYMMRWQMSSTHTCQYYVFLSTCKSQWLTIIKG